MLWCYDQTGADVYPLVICCSSLLKMAIEISWIFPLKMVIFHCYVSSPEGKVLDDQRGWRHCNFALLRFDRMVHHRGTPSRTRWFHVRFRPQWRLSDSLSRSHSGYLRLNHMAIHKWLLWKEQRGQLGTMWCGGTWMPFRIDPAVLGCHERDKRIRGSTITMVPNHLRFVGCWSPLFWFLLLLLLQPQNIQPAEGNVNGWSPPFFIDVTLW